MLFLFQFLLLCSLLWSQEPHDLFTDLELVREIDREINDELPFYYSHHMMGGYFNMPSSRMSKAGNVGIGAGRMIPYTLYGVNLQVFSRLELAANYRNFMISPNNTERVGHIKLGILLPEDGLSYFPALSVGLNDFLGVHCLNSPYLVATKQIFKANLELSLGYGWKKMKGGFGGLSWSPLRNKEVLFLKNISFLAEYDAMRHQVNWGFAYLGGHFIQASLSTFKGDEVAASLSVRYPLGTTKGFLPKVNDPKLYYTPVDTEPLGHLRSEKEFAQELAYGFSDQGLDLFTLYLTYKEGHKILWMKVVNNRYRNENDVRVRIQHLLASLLPHDVEEVVVVVEADALPVNSYRFRREDLYRYRLGLIGNLEMHTLTPMIEALPPPGYYDRALLFQRRKEIWAFMARPRLLTFFGSATGKFKYNIAAIAVPEGYLFDEVYYRVQLAYTLLRSPFDSSPCQPNPSQLPNVRTDTLRYYESRYPSLEQGFLQKGWNLSEGWFARVAAGYFEIAYGGAAAEALYYPVNSPWAIGFQAANVFKRRYQGLGFTDKVRKYCGCNPTRVHFIGQQYFVDLYYNFDPLKLDFKVTMGQFLAKDWGARFEVGRTFVSGLRFSVWATFTNGRDRVNCKRYYDKGFAFCMPLDWFLKQSSRTFIGNSISAWLRDVGAQAATGKTLYMTVSEERYSEGICECGTPGY